MKWRTNMYEREKLYQEIWAEPVSKVAKRYEISDVALAKICRKLAVPLPPRGHWTLVDLKKARPRPPLPPFQGQPVIYSEIRVLQEPVREEIDGILSGELNITIPTTIPVPDTLHNPHPLADEIRTSLKGSQPDEYGVHWRRRGHLDLRVSPASLNRALRIYSALLKSMEALGWQVKVGGPNNDDTFVVVVGETIRFGIEEQVKRVEHVPTADEERKRARGQYVRELRWDYHPTGELRLQIRYSSDFGLQQSCSDTRQMRLEERLAEFLELIRKHAAYELFEKRQREREARERAAEHARLLEFQAKREAEQRRIKQLGLEAASWYEAERIRAYVEAARQSKARDEAWIRWALDQANQIDPLHHRAGTSTSNEKT